MKKLIISLIIGLAAQAVWAQKSSLVKKSISVNVNRTYRSDGSVAHIFRGFGYHADQLFGFLDLSHAIEIPEEFRLSHYVLGLEQFTGVKKNYEFRPTCNGIDEDREYRTQVSSTALNLQTRILADHKPVQIVLTKGFINKSPVKFAEVYFPAIQKSFKFATDHVELQKIRNAKLNCDSTGSIAQSEARYSAQVVRCELQTGYGEAGYYSSFELNLTAGLIKNNQSGEVSNLKRNGKGYLFDDSRMGVQKISQIKLPYSSYSGVLTGFAVINGTTYVCK